MLTKNEKLVSRFFNGISLMSKFYDKNGKPISLLEWGRLCENYSYKRIKLSYLKAYNKRISTIWLGLDHSFSDTGKPIIFETMVFSLDKTDFDEQYQERYSTLKEAIEGHNRIVKNIKQTILKLPK